ncbi:MAG: YihY/virulence factor BrkB family protein [Gemmatimonadota bacterium]|nr:YihY/virulence factor BrkB family protein [Gemmatimonadota bacterium]
MPNRPLHVRFGWTLRDYAKRVWDNAGEDNIFFLAGGIAFNILLAAVPFFLLLFSGLGYLLNKSAKESTDTVWQVIHQFLPPHQESADSPIHRILNDIIATRGKVGLVGLIGFVWFTTRLFGSLRTVLAEVFDIEQERSIIAGKIFDIELSVVSTLLFIAYTTLSAYLGVATTAGVRVLGEYGVRGALMGQLEYFLGTAIATLFIVLMFFAMYKWVPKRRIRWRSAMLAGLVTGILFQIAKSAFTSYLLHFNPGSLYSGTVATIVIMVFWTYYSALIFIVGGEVGQVYELRRKRRLQRETFED